MGIAAFSAPANPVDIMSVVSTAASSGTSPGLGATGVSRTPLLDFNTSAWNYLELYDADDYWVYGGNQGVPASDRHQIGAGDRLDPQSF